MDKLIDQLLGSSPKTTVAGFVFALYQAFLPILKGEGFNLKTHWPLLVSAAFTVIVGRLMKDSNGVKAVEGLAMKQALIKPVAEIEHEPEPEPVQKVQLNPAVVEATQQAASAAAVNLKKKKKVPKVPPESTL